MKRITEKRLLKLGFEKEYCESCDESALLNYHYEFFLNDKFLLASMSMWEFDNSIGVYFVESPSPHLSEIIDINDVDDAYVFDYKVLEKIVKKLKTVI